MHDSKMITKEAIEAAKNAILEHDYNPYTKEGLESILAAAFAAMPAPPTPTHLVGGIDALKALVDLVVADTGAMTMDDPDEDSVGWNQHGDLPMTFGHVRRAVSALEMLSTTPPADHLMGIETAPKDGTWFVAYQNGEPFPCDWRAEEQDEGPPREGWFDLFNRSFEDPTHWLPVWGATTEGSDNG